VPVNPEVPVKIVDRAGLPKMFDTVRNGFVGTVRQNLVEEGRSPHLTSPDDKTQSLSLLQEVPRNHPSGGDDVCALSTFASKCSIIQNESMQEMGCCRP